MRSVSFDPKYKMTIPPFTLSRNLPSLHSHYVTFFLYTIELLSALNCHVGGGGFPYTLTLSSRRTLVLVFLLTYS